MFTHPEAMRALSVEIRTGLLEEAAAHRRLGLARERRRASRGGRHHRTWRHRTIDDS